MVAECAEGFHSYANGTCCADVVEQRVGGGCACSIGYVSAQGCTADKPCPSGTELVPNDDNTAASCVACDVGAVSSVGGLCEDCAPGRVPNAARSDTRQKAFCLVSELQETADSAAEGQNPGPDQDCYGYSVCMALNPTESSHLSSFFRSPVSSLPVAFSITAESRRC